MPIGRDKRGDGFAVVGAVYLADTVDDIHRRIGIAQYLLKIEKEVLLAARVRVVRGEYVGDVTHRLE